MTVAQRLLSLMLHSETLNPQVQWRVFREATRTGDTALLIQLVQHPALDPDVDAALSESPLAAVRAAWIARPGRSAEDVTGLIATESRVTVLAAIVDTPGISEEALETAANRLSPTKLLPVLSRGDLSMALRERLTRRLADTTQATTRFTLAQLAHLPSDPNLVRILLDHSTNSLLTAHCFTIGDVTDEDVAKLVDLLARDLAPAVDSSRDKEDRLERAIASLRGHRINEDSLERLNAIISASPCSHWTQERARRDISHLTSSNVSRHAAMEGLKASTTTAEVESVMRTIAVHRLPELPFLRAAYTLPNIDVEGFTAALSTTRMNWQDTRVLWAAPTDPARTAVLYSGNSWLNLSAIDSRDDAAEVVAAIVKIFVSAGKPLPSEVLQSRYLTAEILASLPVSTFLFLDEDLALKAADSVTERLIEAAGDDTQWATLRVLADEYDGTLTDLLDTARAL